MEHYAFISEKQMRPSTVAENSMPTSETSSIRWFDDSDLGLLMFVGFSSSVTFCDKFIVYYTETIVNHQRNKII